MRDRTVNRSAMPAWSAALVCALGGWASLAQVANAQSAPPSAPGPRVFSPSEQLKAYKLNAAPRLQAADDVQAFLDWAGGSHADEADYARSLIVRAGRNPEVVKRLIDEVEKNQFADFSRALLTLGVLGELKTSVAEEFLTDFAFRPLPDKGTEVDGEILEQTQAAMLQGKAVDGLAYLNTERSNRVLFKIVAGHPSRIVRAEAINAYLWNHGDSEEAKRTLAQFVAKDELIFLDRVRRVKGERPEVFNAKLEAFLKAHPEANAPAPERGTGTTKPSDGKNFDEKPPAF
jgi:hypothetical protein